MPTPSPSTSPSPGLLPGNVGPFTQQLLDSLAPWLADDVSGSLRAYLTALGAMVEPVAAIVTDQGFPDDSGYVPGWSVLLDPDNCPTQFLPFLAQFNGTVVPPGTADADARAIIKAEAGFQRGTAAAMKAAATRNLTGTKFLIFEERTAADGTANAYHIVLGFHTSECRSVAALTAAVEAVKPAGIQITYVSSDGYTWNEAINQWTTDAFWWQTALGTRP